MSSFKARGIKAGGWLRLATLVRHTIKRCPIQVRGEKNHARLAPCAALSIRRVTNRFWRAAGSFNPFEFAIAEKTDVLAIRRPERIPRVFRLLKSLRPRLIKRIEPDVICAI